MFARNRQLRAQLDRIEGLLIKVLLGERRMAASIADLDAELGKSDTTVAALKADNDKIIAILQAGPQSADVTAQLTHLQNVNTALGVILASDDAALAAQTGTSTPTTPAQ
jgi:hypothetical protein